MQLTYASARETADQIVAELAPQCQRIEVAGEVRRKAVAVGQISLVVIANREATLTGERGLSLLDPVLKRLTAAGRLDPHRFNGSMYKRYRIKAGIWLELLIADPPTWGVYLAQQTGPARYAQQIKTNRTHGGLLDDGLTVVSGRVTRLTTSSGRRPLIEHLGTPEERDFLALCGGWVEPEARA